MQKENSFFFFISALGDEGDAFGTKWRKNESIFGEAKVLSPLRYESVPADKQTQRPRRGRIYITAGLDLRGQDTCITTTPRGRTTGMTVLLCDIFEVVHCLVTHSAGRDPRLS